MIAKQAEYWIGSRVLGQAIKILEKKILSFCRGPIVLEILVSRITFKLLFKFSLVFTTKLRCF